MRIKAGFVAALLTILVAGACLPAKNISSQTDHILISEISAGNPGNNNYAYIELYNPTEFVIDLEGHSIWYQLTQDQEDILIYKWDSPTLIPSFGHYLLGRDGIELGLLPDAIFDYPLVPQRGSLAIKKGGESILDQVAWGDSNSNYGEGKNASAFKKGFALERLPGGAEGNDLDTNNNRKDFHSIQTPNPQNTGSELTPSLETDFDLSIIAPESISPGKDLTLNIVLKNISDTLQTNVTIHFLIPTGFTYKSSTSESMNESEWLNLFIGELPVKKEFQTQVILSAPWSYEPVLLHSIYAKSDQQKILIFCKPLQLLIKNESVPIKVARTLFDADKVVVEGTATMYTGGFFAGTSGTKFYIEDETGGIQVYVPEGNGKINIPIGAFVRVEGDIEPYRGAIELIPKPEDIAILIEPELNLTLVPPFISIEKILAQTEETIAELVSIEGLITRIEEFSYSYELELIDHNTLITAYIDKLTGINVEAVEVGEFYQVSGILEIRDDVVQINPRIQSDIVKVYPSGVTLETFIPKIQEQGKTFKIEFIARNYFPKTVEDVSIRFQIPDGLSIKEILNEGSIEENQIFWQIDSLEGEGASSSVGFTATINTGIDYLVFDSYTIISPNLDEEIHGKTVYTFTGKTIPIWAIQGDSFRSPYILEEVVTQGVVTGIFPALQGFWIQNLLPDNDLSTSEGLFVLNQTTGISVEPGDLVEVYGVIHESHEETQLHLESTADLTVLEHGKPLPQAIELNPPVENEDSEIYYEALEGMLVQVSGPTVAVSPSNIYGEVAVVLPLHEISHLMQGEPNGMAIRIDDGSNEVFTQQDEMFFVAKTGDTVSSIFGPLAFTYGYHKVEPIMPVNIETSQASIPLLPDQKPDEFRVMTWNVENLFDYLEPHPSSPDLPTVAEYRLWIEKVANTILAAGAPTLIALQEVENIAVLQDVAASTLLVDYTYQPVLMEGNDSRGIDVGYLVRGNTAIIDTSQFDAPEGLTSRPPLLITVEIPRGAAKLRVHILNNHFLSMSAGELATEPRRTAQAAWNVTIMNQILSDDPDASLIILGDLNSYYNSLPIDILRNAGLYHVLETLPKEEHYTYIYQGVSQVLDHILYNEPLKSMFAGVEILHLNSDFPPPEKNDSSPLHKSDHDPVIAIFKLP